VPVAQRNLAALDAPLARPNGGDLRIRVVHEDELGLDVLAHVLTQRV
jgi:hypothetical protein